MTALSGSNTNGTTLNMSTRMTAGASLKPDSASSRPASRRGNGSTRSTENTAAASVEETMAPSSSASCQSMRSSTCAPTAVTTVLIDHTDGGQRARGCQHLADVGEPSGQTAFDEDDGQRRGADVPGQFDVVELQPQAVLAEHHSDEQEQQQAGKPHSGRHPGTDDAGQ